MSWILSGTIQWSLIKSKLTSQVIWPITDCETMPPPLLSKERLVVGIVKKGF